MQISRSWNTKKSIVHMTDQKNESRRVRERKKAATAAAAGRVLSHGNYWSRAYRALQK